MAYGFGTRAFIEDGPIEHASEARRARSAPNLWRTLSEACRLALIERALIPANDLTDGYPAASDERRQRKDGHHDRRDFRPPLSRTAATQMNDGDPRPSPASASTVGEAFKVLNRIEY